MSILTWWFTQILGSRAKSPQTRPKPEPKAAKQ